MDLQKNGMQARMAEDFFIYWSPHQNRQKIRFFCPF